MNNPLYEISKPFLEDGSSKIILNFKILLYKQNERVFEILDFENNLIYNEPTLSSFFNTEVNECQSIESILYGYSKGNIQIELFTDEFGRVYLPNVGWFLTTFQNESLIFDKQTFTLKKGDTNINFDFEKPALIENTKIEIYKYSLPLLKQCYINVKKEQINVEIEDITKRHLKNLTKAYHIIKENIPTQFELIEKYAPKCVIFNVDTYQRNSFASNKALGVGFYNAYQEDYDEVFFVDDIAHQTGHAIFNSMIYEDSRFFKVDKNFTLETLTMPDGSLTEKRSLLVLFHALYTYYSSFLCLDSCLENNVFNTRQKHEALGRIAFYINKCCRDLLLFDNPIHLDTKANQYFTEEGIIIYNELKNKWKEMHQKWFEKVKNFDLSNQPYNFTFSEFIELNPLK
ncbi:hypothetical protein NAT51_05200 [Flavobacterium amniphilum]|uniref:hypothetical protein n=1 Tax=Flavobacterium amniphilum TaxID=1834035 RepID=UPI00202ABF62|nr:hypothetical protein [Flavobacterium amniphilum]MCL9804905.1 hypothetical protein [Flavobacterium amniphilum]